MNDTWPLPGHLTLRPDTGWDRNADGHKREWPAPLVIWSRQTSQEVTPHWVLKEEQDFPRC